MGRMSMETRQRVVHLRQSGMKIKDIRTQLQEEGVKVSATSLYILVGKFSKTGKICDLHRASRPRILTQEHYKFVDKVISENDETTTRSLTTKLKENFTEIEVSSHTVGRARRDLGWTQTSMHVYDYKCTCTYITSIQITSVHVHTSQVYMDIYTHV